MAFPKQISKILGTAIVTAYMLCAAAQPCLSADNVFTLPAAQQGKGYKFSIATAGGIPPLHWRLAAGTLPPGLVIDDEGEISGQPTKAQVDAYQFNIEVSDSSQPPETYTASFSLTVKGAPLRIVLPGQPLRIVPANGSAQQDSTAQVAATQAASTPPTTTPLPSTAPPIGASAPSANVHAAQGANAATNGSNSEGQPPAAAGGTSQSSDPGSTPQPQPSTPSTGAEQSEGKQAHICPANGQPQSYPCISTPYEGVAMVTGFGAKNSNIRVKINDQPVEAKPEPVNDKDQSFSVPVPTLNRFDTVEAVQTDSNGNESATGTVTVQEHAQSVYETRLLLGTDITRASSSDSSQDYYADAFISFALSSRSQPVAPQDRRLWLWTDAKISSIPSPTATISASDIASNSFLQPSLNNVASLTSAFQFLAGFDTKLFPLHVPLLPSTTVDFILAGGATTPFSPQQTLQIFKNNSTIQTRYPTAASTTYSYVAFESPDRDRFFRQYLGGLRFTTWWDPSVDPGHTIFPGMFDVTFGQDEAATGGLFHGGVIRLDAAYPLVHFGVPWLYVFGTAEMKLARARAVPPLILDPAPSSVTALDSDVLLQIINPQYNDRDIYRIGVGVEIDHAIQAIKDLATKK